MAEQALYQNDLEPPFPFQTILPQLTWVPGYIQKYQKTTSSAALQPSLVAIPKEKDRGDIPLCDQGNLPICGFSPQIVWISDLEILEDPKSPQNPLL
jgi:hypothetical protein